MKLCAKLDRHAHVEISHSVHSFNGQILNNKMESSPETSTPFQSICCQAVVQILAKSDGNWWNSGQNSIGITMLKWAIKSTHTMNRYSTTKQSRVPRLRQHLDACTSRLWCKFRLNPTEIDETLRKTRSSSPKLRKKLARKKGKQHLKCKSTGGAK